MTLLNGKIKGNLAKLILILLLTFVLVLVAGISKVFAVHDEEFELEGNVASDDNPNDTAIIDWEDLFTVSGDNVPIPADPQPAGFGPTSFIRDFKLEPDGDFDSSDDTVFATGSKDTLNPSTGWQCKSSNNVLNQDDLMNVYATAYEDPVTHDVILYFGAERNGNNGTKNVGFWFLKGNVQCPAGTGTRNFTGDHVDGDLFIVSEFSNGGRVSGIKVYEWEGGASGALNGTPIAEGVDCKDEAAGDDVCATVNSTDTVGTLNGVFTPPWLTQTDSPGQGESEDLQAFEFFEGGLNLTNRNLSACFTRFLVNTRSSDQLGATIFDFATGSFPLCGINAEKACSTAVSPNPTIDQTDFESFITTFDVTISKSGPGSVFDIKLEEDSTFATGESCKITTIIGCSSGAPALPVLNFQNGTAVQVCDQITTDITVRIECDTFANGFINSVTARGSTTDGAAADLTDSDTMTQEEACSADVNPDLRVDKICHDIGANHDTSLPPDNASHPSNPQVVNLVYDDQGNFIGFGVDVFVQIENTGDIKLENILLSDDMVTTFTPVSISNGTNTHTTTTFDGTLIPGAKAYFRGSYVAPAPDNNATDPSLATFTDTVTVTGADVLGNVLDPEPVDSAVCPLCPQ